MIRFIQDKRDKNKYKVLAANDDAPLYAIVLPGKEPGKIYRGDRLRYLLTMDWTTEDKYAAMEHQDKLNLPYRITDILGNERGWLPDAPGKHSIAEQLTFLAEHMTFEVNCYRDEPEGDVSELTVYRKDQLQNSSIIAKVSGIPADVHISSFNDYAAEIAVLITAYFLATANHSRGSGEES